MDLEERRAKEERAKSAYLQKMRAEKAQEQPEAKLQRRNRRNPVAAVAAAFAVTAAAVGGVAWGSAGVKTTDEKIQQMQQDILSLHSMLMASSTSVEELATSMRADPNIVLAGGKDLPFDIRREMAFCQRQTINRKLDITQTYHISRFAFQQFREFETTVLNLQNQQLPLRPTFLLAVRAKCLAVQLDLNATTRKFCNQFAFRLTKTDSSLRYRGVGLNFLDQEEKKIDCIIYSLEIAIPILDHRRLKQFKIWNLGRFKSSSQKQIINLPEQIVINQNGQIHPLEISRCKKIGEMPVCAANAILEYNECVNNIFRGKFSEKCQGSILPSTETCLSAVAETFVIVSLSDTSELHQDVQGNRHLSTGRKIQPFDIVNRTNLHGQIQCQKSKYPSFVPEIQIPPRTVLSTSNFNTSYNSDVKDMEKIEIHTFNISHYQQILLELQAQKETNRQLMGKYNNSVENSNSTLGKFEDRLKEIQADIENAKKRFWLHWIHLTQIAGLACITIIIIIIGKCTCKLGRRLKQQRINQPRVIFQANSRGETLLQTPTEPSE